MKHVVFKAYWNYEKEEQWLNSMSAQGLALTDYFWVRYVFEDSEPGEYIYRIQFLEHRAKHPQSRKYIEFVESTGAECIATYMRWAYFRKKAADGPFELYTDISFHNAPLPDGPRLLGPSGRGRIRRENP